MNPIKIHGLMRSGTNFLEYLKLPLNFKKMNNIINFLYKRSEI
jgi:hypothetical protein